MGTSIRSFVCHFSGQEQSIAGQQNLTSHCQDLHPTGLSYTAWLFVCGGNYFQKYLPGPRVPADLQRIAHWGDGDYYLFCD